MTLWNFGYGTGLDDIKGAGWQSEDNLHQINDALGGLNDQLRGTIAPPLGLAIKMRTDVANYLPTFARDGGTICLPNAYGFGAITKVTAAGAGVWSVSYTGVDADADYWSPHFWYDTVDAALWVIAIDTGTSPYTCYLAKIADADGAVTVVGSFQADLPVNSGNASNRFFRRAAYGEGDFTLSYSTGISYVISSSTGAIVSGPTTLAQGGVPLGAFSYMTQDGTIAIEDFLVSENFAPYSKIKRGGGMIGLLGRQTIGTMALATVSTTTYFKFMDWDGYVAVAWYMPSSSAYYPILGYSRFFDKADIDRWLGDMAALCVLPDA